MVLPLQGSDVHLEMALVVRGDAQDGTIIADLNIQHANFAADGKRTLSS